MSRSRSPRWALRAALPLGTLVLVAPVVGASAVTDDGAQALATPSVGATATSLKGLSAPVHDIAAGPVHDIVTTVESTDGAETQKDTDTSRTLILDSRVLFAEDRSRITPEARRRLGRVAQQISQAGATGTVQVNGYTDDQGSAQHGLVLSRQRAEAVRAVLTPLLADVDVTVRTHGYGEANPRFPNADKSGRPIPRNQAKNRRVEITFSHADGD